MKVYYAKVSPSSKEDTFFVHSGKIEPGRLMTAEKMKNEKAKMRSLSAGLLLYVGLCDYLKLSEKETPPFRTARGKWGKPFLEDYPYVHFNLSHSGEYVCCAVSEHEVGADIQKYQDKIGAAGFTGSGIARRFFTEEDNKLLEVCGEKDRQERFFRIWSVRESYIKFTGRGMGQGLDSFAIDWEHKRICDQGVAAACFEEHAGIEGYSLCVCMAYTGQEKMDVQWEAVDLCRGQQGNFY